MRRLGAILAVLLLGLTVAAGTGVGAPTGDGTRILLSDQGAKALGMAARHRFGNRVSADATAAQLDLLARRGIPYEIVPLRTIDASAPAKGKPGSGGGRQTPSSQVPYGIKMIYGNPTLSPAGISGGEGVTVAVLDTGSINHPDFIRADGSKVITGCIDFSQRKAPQVDGVCADGHGHGTHVTGTVAAAGGVDGRGVFGVAPGASVLSYKVLNDRGAGYADDIAAAITLAADRGAQIISMSLGSSAPSQIELEAIRYAQSRGALVIAAAGNSGPNADTIGYPGAFAEVVAVASLNPTEIVSAYSSRGITDGDDNLIVEREVEVAGPGQNVISTYKDGGYATMSGTSMATPHIAGLAAKMWQGSASATRAWLVTQSKAHDITSAEQINNAGVGYDIAAGHGLPQVTTRSQALWAD